ncbi:MAG: hypothetical protein LBL26_03380 [Peptococcaceae bacterium]|jgi:hypothetical protein|nr:hypothetical protein [Peptococcaceae bacterium]
MKKRKLNYRFHDPNPPEVAAAYILTFLIEANMEKVEQAIQNAGSRILEEPTGTEGDSA